MLNAVAVMALLLTLFLHRC